jgi:hypothetical protein
VSTELRFLPWVGENYHSCGGAFGVRLLLVGESMYERQPGSLTAQSVPNMIGSILRAEWTHRFYTTVWRTVGPGQELTTFWNAVAFYNFVQTPVGNRPRQRPSEQAWAESGEAFVAVLESLAPHAVLVLGQQLWWRLTNLQLMRQSTDGEGRLAVASAADAAYINHPSSRGFSRTRWTGRIGNLLARARDTASRAEQAAADVTK